MRSSACSAWHGRWDRISNFPKFQSFVADGDWASAATECRFKPDTGTISVRNDRDQLLFRNAAAVAQGGLDPDALLYPGEG
jgi:hypothetical protein